MATIKKAYTAIISLLEANRDLQVSEIIDNVIELASAKTGGGGGKATSFHKVDGIVQAVHCFYHKVWLSPQLIDFGTKASSASGLNSMCKSGVSNWTKQQRAFAQGKNALLENVASGEVKASDLTDLLSDLEEARKDVVTIDGDYQGFDTLEDCLADLESRDML